MHSSMLECASHSKPVLLVCFNQNCIETRIACETCINENAHCAHQQDLRDLSNIEGTLEAHNKRCNDLVESLESINQHFNQLYQEVIKRVQFANQMSINNIRKMNAQKIGNFVSYIHNFEQQESKLMDVFKKNLQNFKTSINDCLQEIELDKIDESEIQKSSALQVQENKDLFNLTLKHYDKEIAQLQSYKQLSNTKGKVKNKINMDFINYNNFSFESLNINKLGFELINKDNFEKSIEQFKQCQTKFSHQIDQIYQKGNNLIGLDQFNEALQLFDLILQIREDDIYSLFQKGVCLRKLKKHTIALECFEQILKCDSRNTQSLYQKGICLVELKHYQQAVQNFNKILEYDKKNIESLFAKDKLIRYNQAMLIQNIRKNTRIQQISLIKSQKSMKSIGNQCSKKENILLLLQEYVY